MTTPNLNYLVARDRVNDLLREAESIRRAQEVQHPRRDRRPLARLFARRAASVVDLDPAMQS
jgi:hypothetical protein